MVSITELKLQLAAINYRTNLFMGKEINDLTKIISSDEKLVHCVNGHYKDGLALLVATDQRFLLVDHKPFFLNVDTITYSMVQEVSYSYRLLNTTIRIYTSNKTLDFSSMNHLGMKSISDYIQSQVSLYRTNFVNDIQHTQELDNKINSLPDFLNNIYK
jgi:hypothetical protein